MNELKEKIEKMLSGEKKRREVAIKFLEHLSNELIGVSKEMYGENGLGENNTVTLWKLKDGKKVFLDLYYRYKIHHGIHAFESAGFFVRSDYKPDINIWGDPLENVKGSVFWWAVRSIMEWLPLFGAEIEQRNISREKQIEKIKEKTEIKLNSKVDKLQKYAAIDAELNRAKIQHPVFPTNIFEQVAIMNEEAGEVTKAVLQYKHEGGSLQDIKNELIQTAAMCMRMLEALINDR